MHGELEPWRRVCSFFHAHSCSASTPRQSISSVNAAAASHHGFCICAVAEILDRSHSVMCWCLSKSRKLTKP